LQLKNALVRSQYETAMRQLKEADGALAARIGQRAGADMKQYTIDVNTGTCRLKDGA
jgi:hypothetical protein